MVESRGRGAVRRSDARRRGVRPRADAGRDQRHQRARRRGRQAAVELEAAPADERRARQRRRLQCAGRADRGLPITEKQSATRRSARSRAARRRRSPAARRRSGPPTQVESEFFKLESNIVRQRILDGEPRIDGRDIKTVRPITRQGRRAAAHARLGAVHARRDAGAGRDHARHRRATRRSSTRSKASAASRSCSTTTSRRSRVGETGMMGSPKRREIGHGNLARRGVAAVMPDMDEIPVRHPRRLGNPRVERLELDGVRLRHQPVADGRGRADQGAGGRRRDGPGARRRAASRCSPTSSATRITSATWTSRSPARKDGVTALQMDIKVEGITPRDHEGRARRRPATAACTSSAR